MPAILSLPNDEVHWLGVIMDVLNSNQAAQVFKQTSPQHGPYVLALRLKESALPLWLAELYPMGWHQVFIQGSDENGICIFSMEWSGSDRLDLQKAERLISVLPMLVGQYSGIT